jgi:hypothetical protein
MRVRYATLFFVVFFLSIAGNGRLFAQAVSGTILGTVTDPLGAAVPNAQVTIVLTGQSTTYNAVTNESGNFTEPNLPSGTYSVTVTAPGFKKETRENIAVITNTTRSAGDGKCLRDSDGHRGATVAADRPRGHLDEHRVATDREFAAQQRQQLPVSAQHCPRYGAGRIQQLTVLQRQ